MKIASASEMRDHSSPAVSRIVASSPVPNAARTSDIVLRTRLTDESRSARDFQSDWYA